MEQEGFSLENESSPASQLALLSAETYQRLQDFSIQTDEPEKAEIYVNGLEKKVEQVLLSEDELRERGDCLPSGDYRTGAELKELLINALLHLLNVNPDRSSRVEALKVKLDRWKKIFVVYKYCLDLDPEAKTNMNDLEKTLAFERVIEEFLVRLGALPAENLTSGKPDERVLLLEKVKKDFEQSSNQRQQYEQSLPLTPEQIANCHLVLTDLEKTRGIVAMNFYSINLPDHQTTSEQLNYIDSLLTEIISKGENLLKLGYYHDAQLAELQQEVSVERAQITELRKRLSAKIIK